MATTLYLPSSGSAPLGSLAVNTNWELTNGLVRLPCFTTKQNTSLSTSTRTWPATSTQQWCWWQFQSDTLMYAYDWTTSDTVSMVIGKCAETTLSGDTHLAYIVRVVSGDGETIRGVVGLYHATSTEYALMASAATRIHSARTNGATTFSSQVGDRIIIELGLHGVTPAAENIQMRIGDPSATSDFALTSGLTTDLCPWVRLSRDVVFGTPPIELVVQQVESAVSEDEFSISQVHNLTVAECSASSTVDNVTLTQVHSLTLEEVSSSTSAENVVLEVQTTTELVVQEVIGSLSSDNIDVLQQHTLSVQQVESAVSEDEPNISQVHLLTTAEVNSSLTVENTELSQVHNLTVQEVSTSISTDDITLETQIELSVNSVESAFSTDEPELTQYHSLVVDDVASSFSTDDISLIENYTLVVDAVSGGFLSELVTLVEHNLLAVNDVVGTFSADNISVNLPGVAKLFVRHNGEWLESAITVFVEQI